MIDENNISKQIESGLKKTFQPVSADENFILDLGNRLSKRSLVTLEKSKQKVYYLIISLLIFFSGLFIWKLVDMIFRRDENED